MTDEEYQSLKPGDKIEFDQYPWIQQCVIKRIEADLVYLDQGDGEQRYYPAYVQNSGRRVTEWTPKPTPKGDAFEAKRNAAVLGSAEECYVDLEAYKVLHTMLGSK